MSVSTGFYYYSHSCPLLPRFVLLFVPDGISLLFSTDEENPYLLLCLKEGRDRLILITSDGDFGLWFPGWKMSNIFHFSCPTDRKGCCLCIDEYTPQSLWQLIRFFFTFVFPLAPFITSSLFGRLCSADWTFSPKSVNKMMNFYYTSFKLMWRY